MVTTSGNSLFPFQAREPSDPVGLARSAASELRCDPSMVRAVWRVESRERWTDGNGAPLFRFEPAAFDRSAGSWRDFLGMTYAEVRRRFEAAVRIDPDRAYRASSWSVGQIMGLHCRSLGYASAVDMVRAWSQDPAEAVRDWVRWVDQNGLAEAFRNKDLRALARGYNGSGNVDAYAEKLRRALAELGVTDVAEVLSFGSRGPAVRELQTLLGVTVDGFFGAETREAVERRQVSAGLRPDGIVGPRTWRVLTEDRPEDPPVVGNPAVERGAVGAVELSAVVGVAGTAGAVVADMPEQARIYAGSALVTVIFAVMVVALVLLWRRR